MSAQRKRRAAGLGTDPRWARVLSRDSKWDGQFFYSVKTTGVYCRPSCASKPAKPENVEFHASADAAEQAGFRACKRCHPREFSHVDPEIERIAHVCRMLEDPEEMPKLLELANRAGLSASHLHRRFKAVVGVTPKMYAAAHRAKRIRAALAKATTTVTHAIYDAGYNSNGRFYEKSNHVLGMTPTAFREHGLDMTIRFAVGECSLGSVLVAATERGVCAIFMGDDPNALARDLQDRFSRATLRGGDKHFEKLVARVIGLIEAPHPQMDLPLDIRGTAFQAKVWNALQKIPAGTTSTYTEIAKHIGLAKSVRAVANACGANALAVAIPCHRVVRTDGSLSGYRWGVERKRALLNREAKS